MANIQLLFLVILSLIVASIQDVTDNKVRSQEESPLAGIAKEIMKEQNLENIGGMVNNFIQSEGAKQLMGNVLQNLASNENSGQILQSLGSIFSSENGDTQDEERSSKKKSQDDINPLELLSGLGSIVGAMQGAGGDGQDNPAALLQGLGSILGGGNNAGGENNAAALLQGLGSLMGSISQNGKNDDANPAGAILQGLGSILAASNGQKKEGGNAGALLQGLGSLLTSGKEGSGNGLNPELIGNLVNMFANSQGQQKPKKSKHPKIASGKNKKARKDEVSTPQPEQEEKSDSIRTLAKKFPIDKRTGGFDLNFVLGNFPLFVKLAKTAAGPKLQKLLEPLDDLINVYTTLTDADRDVKLENVIPRIARILDAAQQYLDMHDKRGKESLTDKDNSLDLGNIIGMASSFLSQGGSEGNGRGSSSFMDFLPIIMNTINSFTGPEAEERAEGHSGHSWALPPVIERIHIYFDNFVNSDMGKELTSYIQGQQAFQVFKDENGAFSYDRFKELIENHSFRRHWIQRITKKLVDFLKIVSDDNVQKKYINMGITFTNSYLKNTGFPKDSLLDIKNPVQSITNFINFAAKKYLDAEVNAREYVEPAVLYTKDILQMAKKSIATQALTDKLTDTINMEIIEPITRVNRAYRYSKSEPSCDKYLFCIMNEETSSPYNTGSLPELRGALYKGYSLVAGWFLRLHTGTSYWDIYDAVTKNKNCQDYHNKACDGFYDEEVKATTEYIHNEL